MQVNNKVKLIIISDDQAGQRIDNFLLKHLKGVPKSHIYQLLRSGQVRVNSGRKKAHYKLQPDDKLRVPPVRVAENENAPVPDSVINILKNCVIFQNNDIIAINKPSGFAVHKGSGLKFGIIEAFRQMNPEQTIELVHRIDRETSGCLLLAKNRRILTHLHELLRDEKTVRIEKTYLALVQGQWNPNKIIVNKQIAGTQITGKQADEILTIDIGLSKIKRGGEHMMQTDESGDRAISHFQALEIFEDCSLMKIKIDTGRTHQIRVHALHCGHPIVGDTKYGDKATNKHFRELGLKRLFLHARRLYLPLADPITLEAEISEELNALLDHLRPE